MGLHPDLRYRDQNASFSPDSIELSSLRLSAVPHQSASRPRGVALEHSRGGAS